ncbi:MAG TPA: VTT domain-containing protein [Vicinamibacterales bacterium]|nr:VTT domain-containing protein [Vicinamibacterales bacterium]
MTDDPVRRAILLRWISFAALAASLVLLIRILPVARLSGTLQTWVESLGFWGPIALGVVYIIAALLFVPGSLLTLAAGAIYGLTLGMVIVSIASTSAAALAFLIARYGARDRVLRILEQSPRLMAIDRAIGERGWKIVALLRLSPAVPFNLQNYVYGVTAVRFGPAVLASWLAMLPGTFLFVYVGSLGGAAAAGSSVTTGEWVLRSVGLAATVLVTVYLTRVAQRAMREHVPAVADEPQRSERRQAGSGDGRRTVFVAVASLVLLAASVVASARQDSIRGRIERALGLPPAMVAHEVYAGEAGAARFDHSTLDALLSHNVDPDGLVDYDVLHREPAALDRYLSELAHAPFADLGRDDKLALLINAYNAFTLRLILDFYPVESIRDIPEEKRWKHVRWTLGGATFSLDQIEHEQIRPNFSEPRIHFALVCAAIGCPPLRNEAYVGERLDAQLASQTAYVHTHDRWFQFDSAANEVRLTSLYDWYGSDFLQQAPTVVDYAARHVPALQSALTTGRRPKVRWIDYDWRLNARRE